MTPRYDEIYYDVCLSVVRYCKQKIAALSDLYPDLQYLDFDGHSEIHELPDGKDCLGPAGIGLTQEEKMFEAVLSVGVSTINDPGLFRIRGLISNVFGDLQAEKKLPLYRAATTVANTPPEPIGFFVFQSPAIVVPMSRAETRLLQFVQARALLDPMTPLRE